MGCDVADVSIDLDHLSRLNGSLATILLEFDDVDRGRERLADFVGRPDDQTRLRDGVEEFEAGWDDRRAQLAQTLEGIRAAVEATCAGWEGFDVELSLRMGFDE
jgi:hypothetical protein